MAPLFHRFLQTHHLIAKLLRRITDTQHPLEILRLHTFKLVGVF